MQCLRIRRGECYLYFSTKVKHRETSGSENRVYRTIKTHKNHAKIKQKNKKKKSKKNTQGTEPEKTLRVGNVGSAKLEAELCFQ